MKNKDAHDAYSLGETIGITFSQFDMVHGGHINMLREAREQCDFLVVGLQNDASLDRPEKNKPVLSIFERQIILRSIRFVDDIVVYNEESDIEDILTILPITRRFIGEEYKDKDFTGKETCEANNIEIVYLARKNRFSSSRVREEIIKQEYK
jgi:glycerol-3-phosphate cytidylyltransferase